MCTGDDGAQNKKRGNGKTVPPFSVSCFNRLIDAVNNFVKVDFGKCITRTFKRITSDCKHKCDISKKNRANAQKV